MMVWTSHMMMTQCSNGIIKCQNKLLSDVRRRDSCCLWWQDLHPSALLPTNNGMACWHLFRYTEHHREIHRRLRLGMYPPLSGHLRHCGPSVGSAGWWSDPRTWWNSLWMEWYYVNNCMGLMRGEEKHSFVGAECVRPGRLLLLNNDRACGGHCPIRKSVYSVGCHASNQVPWYVLDKVTIKFEYHALPNTVNMVFN